MQAVLKVCKSLAGPIQTKSVEKEEASKTIFVKSDKKIIKLDFDKIHHLKAYGKYIKIYTDYMILKPQTLS